MHRIHHLTQAANVPVKVQRYLPWSIKHLPSYRSYCQSPTEKLKWSYVHGPANYPLRGITIGNLFQERVEAHPEKEAVVFCDKKLRKTFEEFLDDCDQLAAGFLSLGLKKGSRLGIWGPNSYEWLLTQYATARTGIILVNINPAYKSGELQYALNKVGCESLVLSENYKDQKYYEMLFSLAPELSGCSPGHLKSHLIPSLKTVIIMGEKEQMGAYKFSDVQQLASKTGKESIKDLQNKCQFDEPINIQFTSGTMGTPKGATLSHHNIVNNCNYAGRRLGYDKEDTIICVPVPLYHCFGMVLASMCMPCHGAKCVFPSPTFDSRSTLEAVATERCTSLYGVPTMFIDYLNNPDFHEFDLSSLRTGIIGGSPCPIETMKQIMSKMHMPEVAAAYGTTENSPITFLNFVTGSFEKRTTTVGKALDHVEAKIVDSEGNVVPIGETGELCTRGFTTMLGYWDDQEKTAEVIGHDRWYSTGDIAVFDEDGYCKIEGRIKDLIIRGGENIYPLEIEQIIYQHPKVMDVQVVGVPEYRLGEEVCAWIKLKDGVVCTFDEIKDFCKDKIAIFKIPKYIKFVNEYPMTITGKVQKFRIREMAKEDLGLKKI